MKHPEPRMQMLDGLSAGWIDYEGDDAREDDAARAARG
jgi:hypothetical protein